MTRYRVFWDDHSSSDRKFETDYDMLKAWGIKIFSRLEKFVDGEWVQWGDRYWEPKPKWWLRGLDELGSIKEKPKAIEYFRMGTGETFVHKGGTTYWDEENHCICQKQLYDYGITHWRILE